MKFQSIFIHFHWRKSISKVVWKMAAILSRPQCVKQFCMQIQLHAWPYCCWGQNIPEELVWQLMTPLPVSPSHQQQWYWLLNIDAGNHEWHTRGSQWRPFCPGWKYFFLLKFNTNPLRAGVIINKLDWHSSLCLQMSWYLPVPSHLQTVMITRLDNISSKSFYWST